MFKKLALFFVGVLERLCEGPKALYEWVDFGSYRNQEYVQYFWIYGVPWKLNGGHKIRQHFVKKDSEGVPPHVLAKYIIEARQQLELLERGEEARASYEFLTELSSLAHPKPVSLATT